MYKKDYHPDENLIFETEHYKFPVSKSTTEDPDLARTVKIDEALYVEAKVRLNEDTKLNKKIDDEIKNRITSDNALEQKMMKKSAIYIEYGFEGNVNVVQECYECNGKGFAIVPVTNSHNGAKYFYIMIYGNVTTVKISNAALPKTVNGALYDFPFSHVSALDTNERKAYRTTEMIPQIITVGGDFVIVTFSIL